VQPGPLGNRTRWPLPPSLKNHLSAAHKIKRVAGTSAPAPPSPPRGRLHSVAVLGQARALSVWCGAALPRPITRELPCAFWPPVVDHYRKPCYLLFLPPTATTTACSSSLLRVSWRQDCCCLWQRPYSHPLSYRTACRSLFTMVRSILWRSSSSTGHPSFLPCGSVGGILGRLCLDQYTSERSFWRLFSLGASVISADAIPFFSRIRLFLRLIDLL